MVSHLEFVDTERLHLADNEAADEAFCQKRDGSALIHHIVVAEVMDSFRHVTLWLSVKPVLLVEGIQNGKEEVAETVKVLPVHHEAAERYEDAAF